jgi:hypothetical protein
MKEGLLVRDGDGVKGRGDSVKVLGIIGISLCFFLGMANAGNAIVRIAMFSFGRLIGKFTLWW